MTLGEDTQFRENSRRQIIESWSITHQKERIVLENQRRTCLDQSRKKTPEQWYPLHGQIRKKKKRIAGVEKKKRCQRMTVSWRRLEKGTSLLERISDYTEETCQRRMWKTSNRKELTNMTLLYTRCIFIVFCRNLRIASMMRKTLFRLLIDRVE